MGPRDGTALQLNTETQADSAARGAEQGNPVNTMRQLGNFTPMEASQELLCAIENLATAVDPEELLEVMSEELGPDPGTGPQSHSPRQMSLPGGHIMMFRGEPKQRITPVGHVAVPAKLWSCLKDNSARLKELVHRRDHMHHLEALLDLQTKQLHNSETEIDRLRDLLREANHSTCTDQQQLMAAATTDDEIVDVSTPFRPTGGQEEANQLAVHNLQALRPLQPTAKEDACHMRGEDLGDLSVSNLGTLENRLNIALRNVQRAKSDRLAQQRKEKELADLRSCVVCLMEDKCALFEPCKHLCACMACAQSLDCCPICRTAITRRIQVYL